MTTKTETNDLKSDIIHFPFVLSKENNNKNTNEKKSAKYDKTAKHFMMQI